MKFINYFSEFTNLIFEELDFNRDVKVKWNIRRDEDWIVDYTFLFNGRLFVVRFHKERLTKYANNTEDEILVWYRDYGLSGPERNLLFTEIGLKPSKLLDLIKIVTNITLDFISKRRPDILLIKHANMDLEEVSSKQMNKRSKINYKFLKDKLSGYNLEYYAKGNEWFSDMTLCCIFKPNKRDDVDYINRYNFKLNP